MRQRINRKLVAISYPNGELRLYKKKSVENCKDVSKKPFVKIFGKMVEIAEYQIPLYETSFTIEWR